MSHPKLLNEKRLRAALDASDLDVIVASSLENVYYSSGAFLFTQRLIPDRLALVLYPRVGSETLIVCNIEESLSRKESWIQDVRAYVEFSEDPIEVLASVLRERSFTKARIGIETRHLVAADFERLKRELPAARLVSCDGLLNRVRSVKSLAELDVLQSAARATERAITAAWIGGDKDDTEKEVADRERSALLREGASSTMHCVVAAGSNSLFSHHAPARTKLRRGDIMRTDLGGLFDGYFSDVARTTSIGPATVKAADVYRTLWEVQRATIDRLRPGVTAGDVFRFCQSSCEKAGLNFRDPHIGHGIGIMVHEWPMLEPNCTAELEAGMIICVEPFIQESGIGAFHIEDLVLVTESAPVILSDIMDTQRIDSLAHH